MSITTGVIAAAGSGTRMLPVTLGYPKELLPIINQPALQLIIEEFIASGLKKIIIITGENPAPLHRQYQRETTLPRGKYAALDEFQDKMSDVEIIFEPQAGPYGNGTPLVVASRHMTEGEHFIYAFGDDIIKAPQPFTQQLIDTHNRTARSSSAHRKCRGKMSCATASCSSRRAARIWKWKMWSRSLRAKKQNQIFRRLGAFCFRPKSSAS